MRWVYLLISVATLIFSCAQSAKAPIHEVLGKETLRLKVVLLPSQQTETLYQEMAVREVENSLTRKPVGAVLKSAFSKEKVEVVIVTRKKVQKIGPNLKEEAKRIGEESGVDLVVVVELPEAEFSEGSTRKEQRVCVVRNAKVLLSAKVLDTVRGSVLLAGVYEGDHSARQCSEGTARTDKLPSKDLTVQKAIKEASEKFVKDFYSAL